MGQAFKVQVLLMCFYLLVAAAILKVLVLPFWWNDLSGFIKYTVDELSSKHELENFQAIKVIVILDETLCFSRQNSEKLGD